MRELQSYIPAPAYKFLGGRRDTGWFVGDKRYGMNTLSGIGGLGTVKYEMPESSWMDQMLGLPTTTQLPWAELISVPGYNPATGYGDYPPQSGGTLAVPANGGPGGICFSDAGFMDGVTSWFASSDKRNTALHSVVSIPVWVCDPIFNIGVIATPLIAAWLASFMLGRVSKRR